MTFNLPWKSFSFRGIGFSSFGRASHSGDLISPRNGSAHSVPSGVGQPLPQPPSQWPRQPRLHQADPSAGRPQPMQLRVERVMHRAAESLPRAAARALRATASAASSPVTASVGWGAIERARPPLLSAGLRGGFAFHFFAGSLGTSLSSSSLAPAPGQYNSAADGGDRLHGGWAYKTRSLTSAATGTDASVGTADSTALRSRAGAACIPHPDKKEKGGEDSHFISDNHAWLGVADGVGGWAELGIDAGAYARMLMSHSKQELGDDPASKDPLGVLKVAHAKTREQGSCTALILALVDNYIRAANVGDSGFMVIRKGKVLFRSPPQQHDFNFPYQLGSEGSDTPRDAQCFMVPVERGDVLVAGTDGLFDNVFDRDVAMIAARALKAGLAPEACARQLANLATTLAADTDSVSPFAKAAREAGYAYRGGKTDDVTVVVSFIE